MNKFFKNFKLTPIKLIGLLLSTIILIVSIFLPSVEVSSGLEISNLGWRTLCLLLSFLILLVTNALPVVVLSLLYMGLMALLLQGDKSLQSSLSESLEGFAKPVLYFTLASFALAAAFTKTPLSKRILKFLLKYFGKNISLVVLVMMIASALVSSIISNVPTCAVFMSIALSFLQLYKNEEDKKKTGKTLMIAIPVSSMIGGIITPAGSSINLLAIGILEEYCGLSISFIQWMVAGLPIAAILLPLAWFLMIKIYKPAEMSKEEISTFASSIDIPEKISSNEIKTLIIASIMFILWILSSWFDVLNVMIIAILGAVCFFLPGISVLDVDSFLKENSWDAFFLVGSVLSLSIAMTRYGVVDLIKGFIPTTLSIPIIPILMIVCVIVFLCLIILPVATSLVPTISIPLLVLAEAALGVGSKVLALVIMAIAMSAGNCYLLPLDTVSLITYSKGYYSMLDMAKTTVFLQIALTILVSLWLPIVGLMFGLL